MTQGGARVKVWRPQGFTGLEVEIFENAREYLDPKSVLDEYHFNVTFCGSAQVVYAGARHRFRYTRPLAMVQKPGEVYAMDAQGDAMSGWSLSVSRERMQRVMNALELPGPLPRFPDMLVPDAMNGALGKKLENTITAFDLPATRLERESKLLNLLQVSLSHCADIVTAKLTTGREHQAVRQARETLHEHVTDEVNLESLAHLTGLSQGYLLRTFKAEVGLTPHAYQIALRVGLAKNLLAADISAAQVAAETGFIDQSHLSHTFKKYVQTTPGRFQQDSLGRGAGDQLNHAF